MPKSSRRAQSKYRNPRVPKTEAQTVQPVVITKVKPAIQVVEPSKYLKNDLKWTAITTSIVILCLVIAYIFFR